MTATLIILRHAKSDWSSPGLADHDRPLNARGERACVKMGSWLLSEGLNPDRVVCSTALRTRQTLDGITAAGLTPGDCIFEPDLYLAGESTFMSLIQTHLVSGQTLMMIGHNPGSQIISMSLARRGRSATSKALANRMAIKFPTAAAAVFEIEGGEEPDLLARNCRLLHFKTPGDLD